MASAGSPYLLGLRHAFDVDHIAAIDNVTRKLSHENRPSVFVGFWFSLGDSTVVLGMCLAVIFTSDKAGQRTGYMAAIGGVFGTTISAGFQTLMVLVNVAILAHLIACRRFAHPGADSVQRLLARGGLFARVLAAGPARRLDTPWKLYPVGLLFGLGFDTATEIALLLTRHKNS